MKAVTISRDECGHTHTFMCPNCHHRDVVYFSQRHYYRQIAGQPCDNCGELLDIEQVECRHPRRSTEPSDT